MKTEMVLHQFSLSFWSATTDANFKFYLRFNVSLTKVGQNCSNMPKERSKTNQNIEYSVRSKTKKIRQINTNYSATLENIKFS